MPATHTHTHTHTLPMRVSQGEGASFHLLADSLNACNSWDCAKVRDGSEIQARSPT